MINLKVGLAAFMVIVMLSLTGMAGNGLTLKFAGQTVTIKQGQTVTLHAAAVNGVAYQWLKDGRFIPGATLDSLVVSTAGVYQAVSTNSFSCASDLSDPVTVIVDSGAVSPGVADMQIIVTGDGPLYGTMQNPIKYTINIKNNGPINATGIVVQDNLSAKTEMIAMGTPTNGIAVDNYPNKTLTWKVDELDVGKSESMTVTVKVLQPGEIRNTGTVSAVQFDPILSNNTSTTVEYIADLVIPNVFTPNGDGVNDQFQITGLENYPVNEMTIVSRWGATVYQQKNYKGDWNGSGLNEGTYFYVLKVQDPAGNWETFNGFVTLLRTKIK